MKRSKETMSVTEGCKAKARILEMRAEGKYEEARFFCMDTTEKLMNLHDETRDDLMRETIRRLVGMCQVAAGLQDA